MAEEIKKLYDEGKIPVAENAPASATPTALPQSQASIEEFIVVLSAIRAIKRHVTTAPTATPQNFVDQFVFYDDGVNLRLYVYVNGTWRYTALT